MKVLRKTTLCLLLFVSFIAISSAQTAPNYENGWKPYGSYDGSRLDTVNLMNGNLMLHAPLLPDIPQRGAAAVGETLYITSKDWQAVCTPSSNSPTGLMCQWQRGGTGVSILTTPAITVHRTLDKEYTGGEGITTYAAYGYTITAPDGSTHIMHGVAGTEDSSGIPTKYDSIDLTGYHLEMSNPNSNGVMTTFTIADRQGNQYQGVFDQQQPCGRAQTNRFPTAGKYEPMIDDSPIGDQYCSQNGYATLFTDHNGNQMSLRGLTNPTVDTLSRQMPLFVSGPTFDPTDSSGCSSAHPFVSSGVYYYNAPDGSLRSIKQCTSQINVHTAFNQYYGNTPISEYDSSISGAAYAITTIILADGTKWTFDYDTYGELAYVGLPTGGSITYTWTTINFANCSGSATPVSRAVATRTLNDGQGHTYQWNYSWGTLANGSLTNVATDPLGNDTVYVFTQQAAPGTPFDGSCNLYETSSTAYKGAQSANHPLQRVDTTYTTTAIAEDSSGSGGGLGNVFATDIVTTVYPSGRVKKVHKDPDTGLGAGLPIFGNVKKELEYDWGQGQPGPLLRETDTTYQWEINSAYLTAHLLDLPASVVIKDASGNRAAETDYSYDEASYLTAANISTQHVSPPYGVRGNLTTTSHWINTSNSFIAGHTNWYDTGEAYQAIDPLGHTTTYSYDPFYVGAYVTQTCSPATASGSVTHCVSGTYDFNTGVLTSLTNENATAQASGNTPGDLAHTSNYTYDYLFRLTSGQAPPDPGNGNARAQTSFNFSAPNVLPITAQRTKSVTTSLSDSVTSTYDGLGRVFKTQHALPNGTATIDTTFDQGGHVATVSNPYFSTSDPTYGIVTNSYDGLDRVIQTTKQDGSISAVAYNVIGGAHDAVPGANYPGDCTDSTDEAGKQRRACVDGLGRLTMVVEPNPGAAATTASGTVTISGSEQTTGGAATPGDTTIRIDGFDQSGQYCPAGHCTTIHDAGTVSITVSGYAEKKIQYSNGDTAATVAWKLSCAFHNDTSGPADAACPQSAGTSTTVALTARSTGAATNYSFTTSSATTDTTGTFTSPSFTASPVSGAFSHGQDAGMSDSGNITVTVNGTNYTVSFGAGDTGSAIASRLASAINSSTVVSASASGNQVNLTSKTVGSAGNASLSASYTWNTSVFAQPSFTTSASGVFGGYDTSSLDNNPYATLYTYDALGNLTCIEQHGGVTGTGCSANPSNDATSPWRVRRFTYDSLSRLLTATNPESGTVSYVYDNDGNLLQKTSPAPNQTGTATQTISYCYDELHRMTGKGYGAQSCPMSSLVVSYTYDSGTNAKGHLASMTDQAGTATYVYDVLGRLTAETRSIVGVSKNVGYTYELGGSVKTLTYPSGRVVTFTGDSAGQPLTATDGNGTQYITNATYYANGAQYQRWAPTIYFRSDLNSRLQPSGFYSDNGQTVSFFMAKAYSYGPPQQNNGNLISIINNKDSSRTQTFTYDALNRLASAQNAGTDCSAATVNGKTEYWGNSYSYDAWGNLLQKSVTKCSAENFSVSALANNQLLGYVYDAAGNMISNPTDGTTLSYDAENRLSGAAGYTYTYDGNGNRVKKSNGSTGTLYWYMTPGIVAESDLAGILKSEYVFFSGQRVVRVDLPANTIHYYLSDALNSTSMVVSASGTIENESEYYPWGGELQFTANDPNHYKFTGKERDNESGLDLMGARYYGNALGRFMTVDPLYIEMRRLANPQMLNLYAYAVNNPVTLSDPTGLDVGLKCDTAANCGQAVKDFNGRSGAQFKTYLGKDNKLHIVKGSVAKNLTKAEAALKGAITDTKNHATINIVGDTGQSEFGVHNSPGVNTADLGNISKMDAPSNNGGLNSGDVLAHEAMDAYYSLSTDALTADHMASGLFPGLGLPTGRTFGNVEEVLGEVMTQPITDGRGSERQTIILNTPIPKADLQGKTDAQKDKMFVDAGSRVQGVTFEKPKQ